MTLNKYIIKTRLTPDSTGEVLLNTVSKKHLPIDATETELRNSYFLDGQERECLDKALHTTRENMIINLFLTTECNLRCSHCSVLHVLEKKDPNHIDKGAFEKFFDSYFERFPIKLASILYIGGEALLRVNECLELYEITERLAKKHNIELFHTTTTNLAYDLTPEHYDFFSKLQSVQISIDGNHDEHNRQRHAYSEKIDDCYEKTILNLKRLVKAGLRETLEVQAAVRDEIYTKEHVVDYYKTMMRIGIRFEKIRYKGIHPTVLNPKRTDAFVNSLSIDTPLRNMPCCKFRFMRSLQVNSDNTVWDNFYIQEFSKLGTLYDSVDHIEKSNRHNIESMPILNDDKCLQCPVIGYCWGHCIKGYPALKKPSELCNQQALINKVNSLAEKGELISSGA